VVRCEPVTDGRRDHVYIGVGLLGLILLIVLLVVLL
jgi:hypothetical protein